MKKLIVAMLCLYLMPQLCTAKVDNLNGVAKKGYHFTLKIPGTIDTMAYLVHYYGKSGPTVFKSDSAKIDKNGLAEFRSRDLSFVGGIYLIMVSGRKTSFEILLNPGVDFSMTIIGDKIPADIKFKNSPENERFQEYQTLMSAFAKKQEVYKNELAKAISSADTADIRTRAGKDAKELNAYRKEYGARFPGTLLSNIFGAMELPEVPGGDHFLPDGKTKDSAFAYKYYKSHYWDGYNFQDDRLIYTPIYDGRLDEYLNKFVVPIADSVKKECDMLLRKTRGTNNQFHYTLWFLTRFAENSKIMGMDEVFVHLIENYYMKGDATWLSSEELDKYLKRGQAIAPTVLGNLAYELKLPDVFTQKDISLHGVKAKYTLLVFYAPTCGHCQKEMPLIDSVYEAVLKDKGVTVYTMATEGDEKAIGDFLTKIKVDKKWTNTWDPKKISNYHNMYDVYSTPTLYLLDDKKIIRGKKNDHSNVARLVEMLDRKETNSKK